MLMGEYDFTDNFSNSETYWLSKVDIRFISLE